MQDFRLVGALITPQQRFIRGLEAVAFVSDEQKNAIEAGLTGNLREYQAGEAIASQGDQPDSCAILIEGLICRCHYLNDGSRQILSFHIPGDTPDVQSLYLRTMDHAIESLDRVTVLHVDHRTMFKLLEHTPSLSPLFWRQTLIDASIFRMWITNVGHRQAASRIAHLLCETMSRLQAVGLSDGKTCKLSLTQADIGDASGITAVHVNRCLQQLRADRLIELRAGSLTVLDWDGLIQVADFDPAYLHMRAPAQH